MMDFIAYAGYVSVLTWVCLFANIGLFKVIGSRGMQDMFAGKIVPFIRVYIHPYAKKRQKFNCKKLYYWNQI